MNFKFKSDLVPLFSGLVEGLQPFAAAQEVDLVFESATETVPASYNPEELLSEIAVLLSRVVSFTPQGYKVLVTLSACDDDADQLLLAIENTGVDLSKLGELLSVVKTGLEVKRLEGGTRFIVSIPLTKAKTESKQNAQHQTLLPKKYPMYHTAITKRLSFYFSKMHNFEQLAEQKGISETVFLNKINALIHSHIADPNFKVSALADAMACGRTQLFRKLKNLTKMSPQQYLRFVRLVEAKKLLQSNDADLNVSEVGYAVGFVSKSHFTRSFQKEFGFNPSDYR